MEKLAERVAWAITIIKDEPDLDKGIRDVDLARILGVNEKTLNTYRKCRGTLKGTVLEALVDHYHFNPLWLHKSQGEPFPGAREKYSAVCGPEPPRPTPYIKDRGDTVSAAVAETSTPEFNVSEDLALAARVLKSRTSYAIALHLNIRSFDKAIRAEDRIDQLESNQLALQAEMSDLRREVNRLKATYEYPDGVDDSLTGTGD